MAGVRAVPIGNERFSGKEQKAVNSPYDAKELAQVPMCAPADVDRAVTAATEALAANPLPAWRRAEILDTAAQLLKERTEQFARTIAGEAAKPLKTARVEAQRAVSTFTFAAVAARTLTGEAVPIDAADIGEGRLAFTLRVPIGVVGAITPFNFPLNLVAHKLAPAIAAGCPVVLKPASQTPLSALLLAELEEEAGLPPGWLSVVVGPSAEIGDVLIEDERVEALTVYGSGQVGWALRERAPRKRVNLELGNATPVVVAADADLDEAAAKLVANAFSFAGQSCISVQRIYVERAAYDGFLERFPPQVEALKIGDPADEDTDVGPVIDEGARERILDWIEEARAGGARILAGGNLDGELIRPTVIADAAPDLKVSCEEVFGPVCTVNAVESLDEAGELANSTRYGLQAGGFVGGLRPALDLARRLEFGGVTINEAPTFRADQMPYGGVKDSGNTREGPAYAVRELTEERRVRDLGGLVLEMYKRQSVRQDLVDEQCAELVSIEDRLHELDALLSAAVSARRAAPSARCECGTPILWGSHFCANCGRALGA